ncbi:MAG: hypothetical protein QG626_767 [Patescibacteria group bacterium]|nr:hypothetical protein [Patescibacteria group bacterium]
MLPLDPSNLPERLAELLTSREHLAQVNWACNVSHLFPLRLAPGGFRLATVLGITVCGVKLIALFVDDALSFRHFIYCTFNPEVLDDLDCEDGLAFALCADHLDFPLRTLSSLMIEARTACLDHEYDRSYSRMNEPQTETQAQA